MAANGDMLGHDQPVILHLLDIEPAKQALEGVKMELMDAAYPLLVGEFFAAAPTLPGACEPPPALLLLHLLLLMSYFGLKPECCCCCRWFIQRV
jgi:hypothetical protein